MRRNDSDTKRKILETLARREKMFPSKTWFIARKPHQTKMLDDHSTAFCRDCVSADLNYEVLYKACKNSANVKLGAVLIGSAFVE